MAETLDSITSTIIWRPIGVRCDFMPDADMEILIYDAYLDDVVKGHVDYPDDYAIGNDGATINWIDQVSGESLVSPQFWTDVPFPVGK